MLDPQGNVYVGVPEFIRRNTGISRALVYSLLNKGELEGVRVSERKWMIRADALDLLRAKQQEG